MRLGVAAAVVEGVLLPGDVEIADGRVVAVGLAGAGTGAAIPGLVDLQVNGLAGVDFAAADTSGYRRASEALLEHGVTAFQPTLITAPEETLVAALTEVPRSRNVIGAHLEGPFISPERLGAHPADARLDPDRALLERLLAAGPVTQVTLAPELDGALDLIDLLCERGVVVSCGHSDATAEEAQRAFDRGALTVTHLFNAMRPFAHRHPGIGGAALAREDVTVQLIADGVHLADETLLLAWRAAAGRAALVSDQIAGAPRRPDGMLTGSNTPLIDGVRRLHALGVPLADAVNAATRVPAGIARRPDFGTLTPGAAADVVVLDDALEIVRVISG
ncbi:MAG: amidohydrolase family protein [Actinomycetota bacterium]|nr:amidohydrolase family protein [Actinomycetota bacterium]